MINKCDVAESCPAMVRMELPGTRFIKEISARDPTSAREALGKFVEVIRKTP
jgi:hypothetical protein